MCPPRTDSLPNRFAAVVKRGAIAIGRDPSKFSGHSLRHGFLTQAARNGSDIYRVAAQSRHRDVRTVMTYVQDETRFDDHPGQRMLRAREGVVSRPSDGAMPRDEDVQDTERALAPGEPASLA